MASHLASSACRQVAAAQRKVALASINLLERHPTNLSCHLTLVNRLSTQLAATDIDSSISLADDEFRVLKLWPAQTDIFGDKRREFRRDNPFISIPRTTRMAVNQDWSNVWPAAASFKPSVVPLPVRMGKRLKGNPAPDKWGNLELMKIQNFLHLTPPAIEKQCKALKQFCTPWPKSLLADDAACERHLPVELFTNDYLFAGTKLRNQKARVVSLRVKLSTLPLDHHAKDKLLRLVGDQYDPKTDTISFICDRCPSRVQNIEHAEYLLTALFFEAWKTEDWESDKTEADWEHLYWEKSASRRALAQIFIKGRRGAAAAAANADEIGAVIDSKVENTRSAAAATPTSVPPVWQKISHISDADLQNPAIDITENIDEIKQYADSVRNIHDGDDRPEAFYSYKDAVEKLLFGEASGGARAAA